MGLLPPVTQDFTVNAAEFLAGIDEMIAGCERLTGSIDEVAASTARMDGSDTAAAEAETRLEDAASAVAEAVDRQITAMDDLAASQDRSMAAVDGLTAAIDEQNLSLDATAGSAATADESTAAVGAHGKVAFLAIAAAVGYSIVKAAEYQSQMTKLLTQAGVAKSQFKGLELGVLQLAGQIGQNPASLAMSLYHVESNFESLGITAPKALALVKVAAEGANVGGADLVDVTNALTAAVASGIPGVQNFSQAMGALNAIVGAGDMTMQDLADAFGTGMVAVVKGYGLSLRDVGAALDVFGDNNIRGAKAGTDLRMSVQALAVPMATAAPLLAKLGMNSNTLANDMQHGGLLKALDDLTTRFHKAGITAKQQGEEITAIFGKRAGAGLSVLMDQMDRLRSKYPALTKGAHDFGRAWATTQETVQQKFKDFKGSLDALAISFGTILLPAVTKVLGYVNKFLQLLEKHPLLAKFAGGIVALGIAMGVLSGAMAAASAISEAFLPAAVIAGVIALGAGLYEAYKHCKTFRDAINDIARFFKGVWTAAVHAAGDVLKWFTDGPLAYIKQEIAVFSAFWKAHGQEIAKIWQVAWDLISAVVRQAWDIIKGIVTAGFDILKGLFEYVWNALVTIVKTAWNVIATVIRAAIRIILDIISVVLDLITGKWGQAWDSLKDLAATALHAAIDVIKEIGSGFISLLYFAGKDLVMGLINGVKAMFGAAVAAVEDLGKGIVSAAKDVLHIFSPSKDFEEIGLMVGKGLIKGLEGSAAQVRSASAKLADAVKKAFTDKLIGDKTATRLTDFIDRDNTRLQGLANKRAAILKTIAAAEKYATATASSVASSAGLTNLASVSAASSGSSVLYSGDILSDLQGQLAQIRQFAAAIRKLAREGLSKNLLNQIIQAGPQQGLQIATALLDGPISVIKQMNQTQAAITSSSNALGKTAANLMYDSGSQAGKGFLSGLEAQRKSITKLMERIAKDMVRTIRRELGISSPSTVAHYHGLMFARGLAEGMDEGRGQITASAARLALAMGTGAHSGGAAGPGGGGDTINVHLTVNGFVGSQQQLMTELYQLMQKAALQYSRRNVANGLALARGR